MIRHLFQLSKQFYFSLLTCLLFLQTNAQESFNNAIANWQGPQTLQTLAAAPVSLIPFPQQVEWTKEKWTPKQNIVIAFAEGDTTIVKNGVRSLVEVLSKAGIQSNLKTLQANEKAPVNAIWLLTEKDLKTKAEGYSLQIAAVGVVINANDAPGFYYAVQTLRQIITQKSPNAQLPGCKITDWPAFALRGFMHDNGRNFQSIEMLKAQLDKLSMYKFNTFHWHLTDNPAWRSQSKIYPQLNEPENRKPGRDPDKSYSFDDIREVIRYARERSMTIIPELDMPGHSAYFKPTFGFKMETEEGMKVLENLIDEFCAEIPASDCPVIHIGSDEVHIPNPKEFIQRMTARVKANRRKVMVWNPGLKPEDGTIEQLWMDDATKKGARTNNNPYVDSYAGYLNSYDALTLVQRYFFQQVCNKPQGDSLALGGILCCWPDTRVDDKRKILLHNPVWPSAITYSEAVWCGRPGYNEIYMNALPAIGTEANDHFKEFEKRLSKHRQLFFVGEPFPYVQFGNSEWQMTGPYYRDKTDSIDKAFAPEEKSMAQPGAVQTKNVTGGVIRFDALFDAKTLSPQANETFYLNAYIFSRQSGQIYAWIGFEAPARSNRRSAGIPPAGKWDANGGTVLINDKELAAPAWQQPGANRYLRPTWETPANEIPYTDEEFYWSRPPAAITLKKGWNKVLVRVPRTYKDQAWMFAFVPVKKDANGTWIEDTSVKIQSSKNGK